MQETSRYKKKVLYSEAVFIIDFVRLCHTVSVALCLFYLFVCLTVLSVCMFDSFVRLYV